MWRLCREGYTPSRLGLRERRRAESPKLREPLQTEKWVNEEELDLLDIKAFYQRYKVAARQYTCFFDGSILFLVRLYLCSCCFVRCSEEAQRLQLKEDEKRRKMELSGEIPTTSVSDQTS